MMTYLSDLFQWRLLGNCFLLLCMIWLAFSVTSLANAQTASPEHRISPYRISENIKIDGNLDEPAWQNAEPITQLLQIQPNQGEPMTEASEIRLLYDEKHLYFGFIFFDSEMDKIVANEMRRDASGLRSNDYGFLILDTYNDRRNAVFFRLTPLGGMEDTAVSNSGDSLNGNWDIVWTYRAKINADNWTGELAIPFSQLRFARSDVMTWGINFGRDIARKREIGAWNPAPKTYGPLGKYRTAYFGSLEGLAGISPSAHTEVLSYVLPGASHIGTEARTDSVFEAGLDLKYGVTSNLTADLTLNTDFAQVEADEEQVNLTRFSLFFPEQRPFFLEGASLFDVGVPRPSFRRPPPLLLFYSRRIGLAQGRAIPIIAGGKVAGKAGPYGIGILNVFTNEFREDEIDEPRTNYSVVRVTRDLFSGSTVGGILINKQDADAYNRAAAIDFAYRPARSLDIRGLWARTFEEEVTARNNAFYFGGDWQNNLFQLAGSYTDIGEDFNPAVGYVRRGGIRHIRGDMRYTPWPRRFGIRNIETGPEVDFILNQENELETLDVVLDNSFELETGDSIGFDVRHTREHLAQEFHIQDVIIPSGDYDFTTVQASLRASSSRKIFGELRVEVGQFFDGTQRGFAIDATMKPTARLSIQPLLEFNRITLPTAAFNASIFGGRVSYSFSTTLFTKLFAQWSSDREVMSTNILFNYIYRPGSDFYLVFNQNYDTGDGSLALLDWTIVGKVTYWWNP